MCACSLAVNGERFAATLIKGSSIGVKSQLQKAAGEEAGEGKLAPGGGQGWRTGVGITACRLQGHHTCPAFQRLGQQGQGAHLPSPPFGLSARTWMAS